MRILHLLEVAANPEDMNIAGFRFHSLQGSPKRWSVRVTGNFRITFRWSGENAVDVDFEDYH
jgi:proteic killer suppression protein